MDYDIVYSHIVDINNKIGFVNQQKASTEENVAHFKKIVFLIKD